MVDDDYAASEILRGNFLSLRNTNTKIDRWEAELSRRGRVEINTDLSSVNGCVLPPIIGIVAVVFIFAFAQGELPGDVLLLTFGIVVALVVVAFGFVYWGTYRYRGQSLIVDHDSLTLLNGFRFSWSEVDRVWWLRTKKGGRAILISVNDEGWNRYVSQPNTGNQLTSLINRTIHPRRVIYMPSVFGDNMRELAIWLTGFAEAGSEENEMEKF